MNFLYFDKSYKSQIGENRLKGMCKGICKGMCKGICKGMSTCRRKVRDIFTSKSDFTSLINKYSDETLRGITHIYTTIVELRNETTDECHSLLDTFRNDDNAWEDVRDKMTRLHLKKLKRLHDKMNNIIYETNKQHQNIIDMLKGDVIKSLLDVYGLIATITKCSSFSYFPLLSIASICLVSNALLGVLELHPDFHSINQYPITWFPQNDEKDIDKDVLDKDIADKIRQLDLSIASGNNVYLEKISKLNFIMNSRLN